MQDSQSLPDDVAGTATATAPDPAPSVDDPPHAKDAASPKRQISLSKVKIVALGAALLGIIFGGTVEYFVGNLFDSTGWFGPTMEALVQEQKSNFDDIRAKLDALKKAPAGSPEAAQLQNDLQKLLVEQQRLVTQTNSRLQVSEQEVARLRQELLSTHGSASGADFYLSLHESITVHSRANVFAVASDHRNGVIDVNLSGKVTRMKPGDFVEFKDANVVCKVFYKTPRNATTGKFGFDLVCAPEDR